MLGPDDDITLFEYVKGNNRETGPALVGIELGAAAGLSGLLRRMADAPMDVTSIDPGSAAYRFDVGQPIGNGTEATQIAVHSTRPTVIFAHGGLIPTRRKKWFLVIILGIVLLIIGLIAAVHVLWIIGIIVLVIGLALAIAGFAGREIGGRRHWY